MTNKTDWPIDLLYFIIPPLLVLLGLLAFAEDDLLSATKECIPPNATFEQEVACYQAIYGGQNQ